MRYSSRSYDCMKDAPFSLQIAICSSFKPLIPINFAPCKDFAFSGPATFLLSSSEWKSTFSKLTPFKFASLNSAPPRMHPEGTYVPDTISKPQLEDLTALIDFQTKLRKDYPTWPFDMSLSQQIGLGFLLTFLPVILNVIYELSRP